MRCTTTSGSYRCKHTAGHEGDCESDDASSFPFGPYRDGLRGRAYLRGFIDVASGELLDRVGDAFLLSRSSGEDDASYRERVWRKA